MNATFVIEKGIDLTVTKDKATNEIVLVKRINGWSSGVISIPPDVARAMAIMIDVHTDKTDSEQDNGQK